VYCLKAEANLNIITLIFIGRPTHTVPGRFNSPMQLFYLRMCKKLSLKTIYSANYTGAAALQHRGKAYFNHHSKIFKYTSNGSSPISFRNLLTDLGYFNGNGADLCVVELRCI
jgi:hypothetical protein